MNTKQLIAIWYTGLAIDIALLLHTDDLWAVVIAIVVLGSLFVLSFRTYDNVKKKAVLAWVGIPMLLCGAAFTVAVYLNQTGRLPKQELRELPIDQQQKVEGRASITNYGWLKVSLYNGSSWRVRHVQVALSVVKANRQKTDERIYDLTEEAYSNDGVPYKNTDYHTSLGYSLGPGESFEWQIKSLRGTPQ